MELSRAVSMEPTAGNKVSAEPSYARQAMWQSCYQHWLG